MQTRELKFQMPILEPNVIQKRIILVINSLFYLHLTVYIIILTARLLINWCVTDTSRIIDNGSFKKKHVMFYYFIFDQHFVLF